MTPLGWLIMLTSVTLVWVLNIWCFTKVLTQKDEPAEPVKDFRSA